MEVVYEYKKECTLALQNSHDMTKNQGVSEDFEGFEHEASVISRYLYSKATGLFTLALKNGKETVHFTPKQPEAFKAWLDAHKIKDIGSTH